MRQSTKGVYVVSLTESMDATEDALTECPLAVTAIQDLLDARPELTLDGERPDAVTLGERLAAFWLPDEVVLYVGLAGTSLATRIDQYYRTELGARSPHAGGWFLKTLSVLPELRIHYATCSDPDGCEDAMLAAFSAGVSEASLASLHDQDRPIPFANLEWPRRRYKKHGITGAKEPRARTRGAVPIRRQEPQSRSPVHSSVPAGAQTQRVTEADIRAGRIRIPIGATKQLFPQGRASLELDLRGERLSARWDPRYGPDRERSGVLGVGRGLLARLVSADEVLTVSLAEGVIRLD